MTVKPATNKVPRVNEKEKAMPSLPEGWSVVLYDERGVQIEEIGADGSGSWEAIAAAIRGE